jgi:hypothetical protein
MMVAEIITREDLQHFRLQLLDELKEYVYLVKNNTTNSGIERYKTKDVRKLLDCSNGKLQALRISGKLRCKKIGGTLYYKKEDIQKLLNEGC